MENGISWLSNRMVTTMAMDGSNVSPGDPCAEDPGIVKAQPSASQRSDRTDPDCPVFGRDGLVERDHVLDGGSIDGGDPVTQWVVLVVDHGGSTDQ